MKPTEHKRHEFTYMGPYVENIDRRLEPYFHEYVRKDGTREPIQERPQNVEGLFVGFMEEKPRKFWAVAVHDRLAGGFIYPNKPLLIEPEKHTDGKGFGPHNNTVFTKEAGQHLIKDLIRLNDELKDELERLAKDAGIPM